MEAYLAYNLNDDIRKESSSGGVFYELAKQTIKNNGVVFGAAWTESWDVDIIAVETIEDIKKLMGSKYVKANLKTSFENCENLLLKNKLVLFCGTPCQISALKHHLKQEYVNLITVAIACHGTMPKNIWTDYLETLKRPDAQIVEINMRSKENTSWENYNFTVSYSDGKKLTEHHNKNRYMQAYLSDKYLNKSCYDCVAKKNIAADIQIGDYWGVRKLHPEFDTEKGASFIVINTNKGRNFITQLDKLKLVKTEGSNISTNNAGVSAKRTTTPEMYSKDIFTKKVGIVTLYLHSNIGGILQTYALQQVVNSLGYKSTTITWDSLDRLNFGTAYCNLQIIKNKDYSDINENAYDIFLVGSDQIWRKKYVRFEKPWLEFTNGWTKVRTSYAASIGVANTDFEYNTTENEYISNILQQFNSCSVREVESIADCFDKWKINVSQVLDPTMLLPKEHYLNLCKQIPEQKANLFYYLLDETEEKNKVLANIATSQNLSTYTSDKKSVLKWLAGFRDAKIIVTDSFHGCVFSIIFNKPFLYFKNQTRGNIRFSTLETLFGISNRCVTEDFKWDDSLLNLPNIDYETNKKDSIDFLRDALSDTPRKLTAVISESEPQKTAQKRTHKKETASPPQTYLYF